MSCRFCWPESSAGFAAHHSRRMVCCVSLFSGPRPAGDFRNGTPTMIACRRARAGDPAARPRTQCSIAVSGGRSILDRGQRQPGFASADRGAADTATAARVARHADCRGDPDRRRDGCGGRPAALAGEPALYSVRDRPGARSVASQSDFQCAVPAFVERQVSCLGSGRSICRAELLRNCLPCPARWRCIWSARVTIWPAMRRTQSACACPIEPARPAISSPAAPACPPDIAERLRGSDLVFFDGTLWTDDEMIREGSGTKTGQRMGHMSVADPRGTIEAFRRSRCAAEGVHSYQQQQPHPAGQFAGTGDRRTGRLGSCL